MSTTRYGSAFLPARRRMDSSLAEASRSLGICRMQSPFWRARHALTHEVGMDFARAGRDGVLPGARSPVKPARGIRGHVWGLVDRRVSAEGCRPQIWRAVRLWRRLRRARAAAWRLATPAARPETLVRACSESPFASPHEHPHTSGNRSYRPLSVSICQQKKAARPRRPARYNRSAPWAV